MYRSLFLFFLLVLILSVAFGSATSSLPVDGGAMQVFEYTVSIPTPTPTATPTPTCTSTSTLTPTLTAIIVHPRSEPGKLIRTKAPAPTEPPPPTDTPPIIATPAPSEQPTVTPTLDWDRSSLEFIDQGSSCDDGGMLWAELANQGENMSGPTTWELYSGEAPFVSGSLPIIPSGENNILRLSVSQAGKYKYKVYQRPGHPGPGELWSQEIAFDPGDCVTPVEPPTATPTPTQMPSPTEPPTETPQPIITDTPIENVPPP